MKIIDFNSKAVNELSKILKTNESVEFTYSNLHYEIFVSSEGGYIVNVYSNDEKDEYGSYLEKNNIDGGLCTGSSKDAVQFMIGGK